MSKDGLCAIVTGSASGLGAATAQILATQGARIIINYSNSKAEAEATAELCRKQGAEVLVVQGDVSRDEDCKKIAAAAQGWGRVDVLVNNAGTTKHVPHHNLDGLTAEDFQRIYAVNTIGPFQMVRAARALLEAGAKASGRPSAVVNVSSVAGISGGGSSVAYAASKGGIVQYTRACANAWAPDNIQVNAILPGWIDTDLTKGARQQVAGLHERVLARTPAARWGAIDDFAGIAVFLASPASDFVTGTAIPVDGGYSVMA